MQMRDGWGRTLLELFNEIVLLQDDLCVHTQLAAADRIGVGILIGFDHVHFRSTDWRGATGKDNDEQQDHPSGPCAREKDQAGVPYTPDPFLKLKRLIDHHLNA